ncbi:hypothetical protein H5410_012637 [Solanum commersonii]|uniref:Uncharacterized protein n=1 Tax=Solanum commersonii TaxID=4109 RepID=A0A9J6ASZ9_SOLCO|nr:hypothetical protein H5410_012637 [Solanum commersonii]
MGIRRDPPPRDSLLQSSRASGDKRNLDEKSNNAWKKTLKKLEESVRLVNKSTSGAKKNFTLASICGAFHLLLLQPQKPKKTKEMKEKTTISCMERTAKICIDTSTRCSPTADAAQVLAMLPVFPGRGKKSKVSQDGLNKLKRWEREEDLDPQEDLLNHIVWALEYDTLGDFYLILSTVPMNWDFTVGPS